MASEETYLTKEGEDALRRELTQLRDTRRPALAQRLKEAAAQGDLKENADYHDAKEKLGFIEGRVQQIESILRNAIVVDSSEGSDEVRIGTTVIIREDGEDDDEEYRIVGSAEANPRERKISEKSPIGSALLGKRAGEKVKVETPDGVIKFRIVEIR
ncbi:MAG: transcription elongation factor GreA [Chloroflexota bacterium]|nr:transcription elongation factor GreA [Chloroflexota bacterium]